MASQIKLVAVNLTAHRAYNGATKRRNDEGENAKRPRDGEKKTMANSKSIKRTHSTQTTDNFAVGFALAQRIAVRNLTSR